MAAPYLTAFRTALKGVQLLPGRWLLTQRSQTPALCQCLRLHASSAAPQSSSRTEPHRTDSRGAGKEEEEEEEREGPEYIPRKKAKNPMIAIGYAWMIGLPTGIISFILAKRQVDKNRMKQRKVRQRMRKSNEGEYEGSRYRHRTESVKLD
ncbi:probable hydrolase PNKD [Pempheris klunzingeri]|uniref:probable hydrolase PNKD n=1 Tax=Pempheris klunzingeri TaxID=3127111 RepID=UPI00397ECC70